MRTTSIITLCVLAWLPLTSTAEAQFNPRFRTNLRGDMLVLANSVVERNQNGKWELGSICRIRDK